MHHCGVCVCVCCVCACVCVCVCACVCVSRSVSKLLMSRIKDYGFPPSYKGILSFLDELNRPELRDDEGLNASRLKLMALLMP